MAKYNKLALVGTICVADGWYGNRYRYLLTDGSFSNKQSAKKHATMLKRYIKEMWPQLKLKSSDIVITCAEYDSYVDYTHISNGPSLSYKHIDVTIDKITPE